MTTDTLIIGGGLSGLYAAHLLSEGGRSFRILEAAPQFGGRIRTAYRDGSAIELGPSWFWPENNPRLARLVKRYDLPSFAQHTEGDVLIDDGKRLHRELHQSVDPRRSRRLTNGTHSLIDVLLLPLPTEWLHADHHVTEIARSERSITVTSGDRRFTATNVIIALPPRIVAKTIEFEPMLPSRVMADFRSIPTWMAGEAKFFALYDEPFWRSDGLSGSVFSHLGPLSETHDASHPHGVAALLGFFSQTGKDLIASGQPPVPACLDQLARCFGTAAASPIETVLMDWSSESLTSTELDVPLLAHPAYSLPESAQSLWEGHLHFAGTEFAPQYGGYLEGALEAAERAVQLCHHQVN